MGYYITQVAGRFFLHHQYFKAALKALKEYPAAHPETMNGGSWGPEGQTTRWWSWVDMDEFYRTKTLPDALKCCRWNPDIDQDGNIDSLFFDGEKSGDEQHALIAIAPWVATGSYIEMRGEEGEVWRWVFRDGHLEEVGSSLVWEQDLPAFNPERSSLVAAIRLKEATIRKRKRLA